ncbi:hypothetical protein Sru01_45250 [Sphaerisporangium rufum]|uniref:Uncharacterized protein n=1 Tax=Sphaerisporangium rufum TaxID=1381558 RepID=A0A919V303_9ACTN|nr:hypothetical protein Sru01_45250 [Sphaerisporangium rufum]
MPPTAKIAMMVNRVAIWMRFVIAEPLALLAGANARAVLKKLEGTAIRSLSVDIPW